MSESPHSRGEQPLAAIRYHPRGFDIGGERVMGLQSANSGFLAALARSVTPTETFYGYARSSQDFADFRSRVTSLGMHPGAKLEHIPFTALERLSAPGCLYLAAPALGLSAWHRRFVGNRAYSLCGVTHTMSTDRVMDALVDFLVAPVQTWDALVCTSTAVRSVVNHVLDEMADYLTMRMGIRPAMPVRLPIIPLGVDTATFAPRDAPERRQQFRAQHRIDDDDVAVLFFGRLSAHSKAHPLPMYRALERASEICRKRLTLILAGWFYNEETRDGFLAAASVQMPSVRLIVLDGRAAAVKAAVWHGSDMFISLTDNIQESFGLTPIEAMAAGLPSVISDWDGYRDTMVDGESGFFVPTLMAPAGAGEGMAIARALEAENHEAHIARASQSVAVDIEGAAQAIARLAANFALRRQMGAAGRRLAAERFDWPVIVAQYRELWAELAEVRHGGAEIAPRQSNRSAWPAREDSFAAFAGFASDRISEAHRIDRAVADPIATFKHLVGVPLTVFDADLVAPAEAILRQLTQSPGSLPVSTGDGRDLDRRRSLHLRAALWLAKMGIVRIVR